MSSTAPSSSSSSSSEPDNNNAALVLLPSEIILDILIRLPAKSVGRFRTVSKPWNSTLSQPDFIRAHLKRNKQYPSQNSLILFPHSFLGAKFSAYTVTWCWRRNAHHLFDEMPTFVNELNSYVYDYPYRWIAGFSVCDGLVLMVTEPGKGILVNPATKVVNELPLSPFFLDFHPGETKHGIGYDLVSDDYKVVTLTEQDDDDDDDVNKTTYVNVYSVRNRTWKIVENYLHVDHVLERSEGVFLNNYIHWLATRTLDNKCVIVRFDLAEEIFNEMATMCVGTYADLRLMMLDGCLSVFDSSSLITCVMREYGVIESWAQLRIVAIEEGVLLRPLCKLGKEVMMIKAEMLSYAKLVIYDCEKETFEDVVVDGIPRRFCSAGSFMESLVSPFYK